MNSMGLSYSLPLFGSFLYITVYTIFIQRAAIRDVRNIGGFDTRRYVSIILRERISRFEVWTIGFFICICIIPVLFFAGISHMPTSIKGGHSVSVPVSKRSLD
jgi:hypothetical protein